MKTKLISCNLFLATLLIQIVEFALASPVTYQWPTNPIELNITVGSEQQITLPGTESIRVGVPNKIERLLKVEVIGPHLWVTPLQEFELSRIIIVAPPNGRLVLQINSVKEQISNQPIVVQSPSETESPEVSTNYIPSYGYVTLTRWVVQQLYAPQRLLTDLPGVNRVPVDKSELEIFRCGARLPTLCAGGVVGSPLASWQSNHHYVTAVEVQNKLAEPVVLDARELRGNWRAAAFVHNQLRPFGQHGDNTVLVLISDFPHKHSYSNLITY